MRPLHLLAPALLLIAACTPMPRASVPQDEPFVLLVHAHHEEDGPKTRASDTLKGFARLSIDSGFGTLEAWETLKESYTDRQKGHTDEHVHRTAITWRGGDAISENDALVVYFDGSMTSCREFDAAGVPLGERDCPGFGKFALVCRPSAVLVDGAASSEQAGVHPASALRCALDGDAPHFLSDMMVEGALWFPLEPNVRLSREGSSPTRFEPAPPGWTAMERPVQEP
jgi:hypothetical protein